MIGPPTEDPFDPADWADWMREIVRTLKVGGVWGAPSPGFVMMKVTNTKVRIVFGALDARTIAVLKAAEIEIVK